MFPGIILAGRSIYNMRYETIALNSTHGKEKIQIS